MPTEQQGFQPDWDAVRIPTEEHLAIFDQCLEVAAALKAGELPLEATYSACTPRFLWIAINQTDPFTPDREALKEFAEVRVRAESNTVMTDMFNFARDEIQSLGAIIQYGNPDVVYFPYLTQWAVPPTRTSPGVPGEFVYRKD